MKILCVNNTADIYGASRCVERVFGRLARTGLEIHVVLPEVGPLVDRLEKCGIKVHIHKGLCTIERAELKTLAGMCRFATLFPYSVIWLAFLMIRLQIDIVHTNTVVMPSPALAAFITGKKHVWHVRELLGEFGLLWRPYQRYVCGLSKAVIAISRCTRDQFNPNVHDKIRVIYDGVDQTDCYADSGLTEAFRKRFPDSAQLVGVIGRIKWHRKGQEVLVRAANVIRRRKPLVHYVLVGSPAPGNESHLTRLNQLIEDSGLADAVSLIGDIPDPAHVFAALDVAVVPSVQPEPFGCVVMEAMAVGTPVVGSRCGGIAEQISDGLTGLLFPPGDFQALAEAIDKLLEDESLRRRIGGNGFRHARDRFNVDQTCSEMLTLFSDLMELSLDETVRIPQKQ